MLITEQELVAAGVSRESITRLMSGDDNRETWDEFEMFLDNLEGFQEILENDSSGVDDRPIFF